MFLRVSSAVTVLMSGLVVGLVIDLGLPSGQALAQYYPPPPPYPAQSYPGPNRPQPPAQVEQDDDLDALGPPRTYGYPGNPQPGGQYGGRAAYPQASYPQASYPQASNPQAGYPQDADPYAPSPYPNGNPPPPYSGPANAYPSPAPYPSQDGIRPPMSIGPDQGQGQGQAQAPSQGGAVSALPPDYQPETGPAPELSPQFRRTLIDFRTKEPAGTIIIDTPHTYLYLVLGNGKAMRYGIGVGREGFTWAGTERISRMAEWPDWHPPPEMIDRQPYLPRFMAGGESNPLGARALYLGKTLYRIHGTNQPSTIGTFVSSGCIRLTNEDVSDLYSRVQVGTRVVVMPGTPPDTAQAATSYGGAIQSAPLAPPPVRTR
jgi:lipoprotein-anchoring transpeptidase ErfK/SrfK